MFNKKRILNKVANQRGTRRLTSYEQELLKTTLLEMTKEIDYVCRRNSIHLFLVGGSLLGAIRHGGFIPWDDDMDFGMIRSDYQKFIHIFDKELGERYYLRCPNSPYPNGNRFMQIFKKGTVLETAEGNTPLQPMCVSIDIFPYDYAPNSKLYRQIKGIWCNGLMLIASAVTGYVYPNREYKQMMHRSIRGRLIVIIETIIGVLFSWKKPEKWFDTVDCNIQHSKKTHYLTSATGRRHYLGEVFLAEVFFPLKETKFENLMLYAPANPDKYLEHNYGIDYMRLPSAKERESHFIKRIEL